MNDDHYARAVAILALVAVLHMVAIAAWLVVTAIYEAIVDQGLERKALAVLAYCALVVVVVLLMACAPRPQVAEPPRAPAPWCFAAVARFDGRDQAARGCFETAALCGNAQRRAVRWGGVAGVREVGACRNGGAP